MGVSIVRDEGDLFYLDVPHEPIPFQILMQDIKTRLGIPKREQTITGRDGNVLTPQSILPTDVDVLHLAHRDLVCEWCGKPDTEVRHLRLCSGCRYVAYCDTTCQNSHWRVHKK